MTIMAQIKDYMKARGIKQNQLSEMTGIDEAHISAYLNDKRNPCYKRIIEFCDVLGLEIVIKEK